MSNALKLVGLDLLGLPPPPTLVVPVQPSVSEHAEVIDPMDAIVTQQVAVPEHISVMVMLKGNCVRRQER